MRVYLRLTKHIQTVYTARISWNQRFFSDTVNARTENISGDRTMKTTPQIARKFHFAGVRYHFVDLLGNKVDLWGHSYGYNGSCASEGDNTIALHTWLERISVLILAVIWGE